MDNTDAGACAQAPLEVLGQLTGQIAHDFNNVLAVAVTSLEIIGAMVDDAEVKRILATATNALCRGRRLTDDLAATSAACFAPVPVDVHALIAGLRETLAARLGGGRALQLRLEAEQCVALTDPGLLATALLGLADNAREAMPTGGSLVLSTRNEVRGGLFGEGGETCLLIAARDTGVGMSQDVQDHAFDLFFSTRTAAVEGVRGIGLAQVRDIARRAGGTAIVDSVPDSGTTVSLTLAAR